MRMSEQTKMIAEYSERRPLNQAWKVRSDGHVTYAESEERALSLHRRKLDALACINEIIARCICESK